MVMSMLGGDPATIKNFIVDKFDQALLRDLSAYSSFTFILPKEFSLLTEHIRIKFEELFVPIVWGRAYSEEGVKHAKTVVQSPDELFISLGVENKYYGSPQHRLHLPLPEDAGYATAMAAAYYTIGRIQAAHPPYFKNSIAKYAKTASEIFGEQISVIVE